jgi:CDP-diacylglycerol--serine O-phosphatidyltransferase
LRLAKFNNDTRQTSSFLGLPVPANALLWIGIVATLSLLQLSTALLLSIVYPLILISCIYLVADIPLLAFKIHFPLTEKKDRILLYIALVLLALGILFVSLLGWAGLLPFVVSYLISSAFYRLLWRPYNK